jgi:hypothetical protein
MRLRWMRALRHWHRSFQAGHLLTFAVQLLDLPAEATYLLCHLGRILSAVVGHDPIRAVGRHLNPEQMHLVVFGKAFDLDRFTVGYKFFHRDFFAFGLVKQREFDITIRRKVTLFKNQLLSDLDHDFCGFINF